MFIMPDSNPYAFSEQRPPDRRPVEEINVFDILATLLRGWKLLAVFLAVGLAAAWLWFPGGPAQGSVKSTLEVVWSPGYLPSSFTVQVPAGRPGETEESAKISAAWLSANALSPPNLLQTLWASFQVGLAASGQKILARNNFRQQSEEPGRLIWACQTTDQAAALEALEALNDLADRFEQYLLAELKRPNNALRARYETSLADAEKALAGQEAALAALRAVGRPGLPDSRDMENDLFMDIAFQEAQRAGWRFLIGQLAKVEAGPVLWRTPSLVVLEPESRRTILVKAAGLIFLALALGSWSVLAYDGWRRHRAKRRTSAGAGGLKG
jgi:hypothetical protein